MKLSSIQIPILGTKANCSFSAKASVFLLVKETSVFIFKTIMVGKASIVGPSNIQGDSRWTAIRRMRKTDQRNDLKC